MMKQLIVNKQWSEEQLIACNNWEQEFPYAPKAKFALKHDDQNIYIKFNVDEKYTKATINQDNGQVWTDSCVEFFIAFDDRGYYNFEFSCIGKMLLAFRKEKPAPTYAKPEILDQVERHSSLGTENFSERIGENSWTLEVRIPRQALFAHNFETLKGVEATANVYKCGDDLTEPHFLSWAKIGAKTPNFHLPAYFAKLKFE